MTFFDNGQRPWFKISKQNTAWLGVSMLSLFDVCFSKRAVQTICHCNKLHEDTEKSSVWFSCQKTPNLFCLLISSLCFCCTRFKHKAGMFKKKKKSTHYWKTSLSQREADKERNWIYKVQWLSPSWMLKGVQGQLEVTLRTAKSRRRTECGNILSIMQLVSSIKRTVQ